MFKQKVKRHVYNVLFNTGKIEPMKPSMALLYKIAFEQKDLKTPAAVARRLNADSQTLKNWESRGISKQGALKVQAAFGFDSNKLLAMDADPNAPPKGARLMRAPRVAEAGITLKPKAWPWPFENIRLHEWNTLTPTQKQSVEGVALGFLSAATTTGPPTKQHQPAPSGAAA